MHNGPISHGRSRNWEAARKSHHSECGTQGWKHVEASGMRWYSKNCLCVDSPRHTSINKQSFIRQCRIRTRPHSGIQKPAWLENVQDVNILSYCQIKNTDSVSAPCIYTAETYWTEAQNWGIFFWISVTIFIDSKICKLQYLILYTF